VHLLVTGAASFIGANFIPMAIGKGWEVTAIVRNSSNYFEEAGIQYLPVNLVRMDITDTNDYAKLPKNVDAIVHLAAVRVADNSLERMISSNLIGSQLLASYAKKSHAKTLIYASSMSVYGDIKDEVVSERTDIINPGIYGTTKYLGEKILLNSNDAPYRGLALRLPSVLGKNAPNHWLSQVLSKIKSDEDVCIYNPDFKFNNAIDVNDLGAFILNTLELEWQGVHAFLMGVSDFMSIREIVKFIIEQTSSKSIITIAKNNQNSFVIDYEYAVKNFSYQPRSIRETLQMFVEWNNL
jgi:UDP-glucuronate 4-epimerase